jgi:hypothetical protein
VEPLLIWQKTKKGRERLQRDRERVAALYPGLQFQEEGDTVLLAGSLNVVQDCGESDLSSIAMRFPRTYPLHEPVTYETTRRFARGGDNHVNADGSFCLWTPEESQWDAQDPDALLRYLEHVIVYLDKQFVFEVTHVWPGQQRAHGDAGRDETICEITHCDLHAARIARLIVDAGRVVLGRKAACPCGSGDTFGKCHRVEAMRVKRILSVLNNAREK